MRRAATGRRRRERQGGGGGGKRVEGGGGGHGSPEKAITHQAEGAPLTKSDLVAVATISNGKLYQ